MRLETMQLSARISHSRFSSAAKFILALAFGSVVSNVSPAQPVMSPRPDALRRQAEARIEQGEAQFSIQANPPRALQLFRQALNLAHQLNDASLVSNSLRHLANTYLYLGETKKSLRIAAEGLSVARRSANRQQEAWALDQVGNAYFYLGDQVTALENFLAAVAKMEESGDLLGKATALRDAGIAFKYLNQYDEGLTYLHEALLLFQRLNVSLEVASVLENLGLGYLQLGAHRLAQDAFEEALEITRKSRSRLALCEALTRMGDFYRHQRNPRRAFPYFKEALAIAEESKSPLEEAVVLMGISGVHFDLGRVNQAIKGLQRVLNLRHRIGPETQVANALYWLGYFHLDREPEIAAGYFRRALAILETHNSRTWLPYYSYARLGQVCRRQGKLDGAIEHYQKAVEYLEEHRSQLVSQQHKATFFGQYQQIYEDLIEALMERYDRTAEAKDLVQAFNLLEQSKARNLVEGISERRLQIGQGLDPELQRQQTELSARIAELERILVEPQLTKGKRRQIVDQLNQVEDEFDNLIVRIRQRNHRYSRPPKSVTLVQAQGLLDETTALLTYLMTKNHLIAFVLTAQKFQVERLSASPQAVAAQVQNYEDLIAQNDASWQVVARRLYSELFAPLRKALPPRTNRLVIIPDGILHDLPFETLMSGSGRGEEGKSAPPQFRYLLEDFASSYAPSATVLAQLRASSTSLASGRSADLLMFANPALLTPLHAQAAHSSLRDQTRTLYEDEGLRITPIPYSAVEAKVIARYVGPGSQLYTGTEASERRVKTLPLDQFRILHFATHALISERTPSRSALVLASSEGGSEDGFLQAREIRELKLASDLVVLSACGTTRGRIVAGEGVQGLAQTFFQAGAQSVVASLWNVNDERTAAFMQRFYQHLADGKTKAGALRAAKLDVLRKDPAAAPRYWAPFILIGEAVGRVPIKGPAGWRRGGRGSFLGGGLVLAAVTTFIFFKRRAKR
jgi:CHAT domain-containing protein